MKAELKEIRGKIDERRKQLASVLDEAGAELDMSKVKSLDGDSTAKVAGIKAINDELDDLSRQAEPLEAELSELTRAKRESDRLAEKGRHPGHPAPAAERVEQVKTIGEYVAEAHAAGGIKGRTAELDVELKTLMTTSAGWAPETLRTGRLVESAQRQPSVIDLLPAGATSQASVVYMSETTFTNNAAEVTEGDAYGEAALALTEVSEPVRKIGTFLPITDEQLDDVAQLEGYVNNRLPAMLRQRLDAQVLVGNGTAPNLSGFLDRSGLQTQAKSTDSVPDAVYKALVKVRVTGRANPTAAIFHPNDWQAVRLLTTADGIYIWGAPSEAGPARIWGVPVIETDAITENKALVGDFANHSELTMRSGIGVEVSNSHDDYFVKGKQAMRADIRAALCVYRETAFCEVTGI
jgi:HK97 family phage major capsid protein